MDTSIIPTSLHKDFESIKKVDEHGYEYWEARELMPLLGYSRWEDFHNAIKRAQATCISTRQAIQDHFRGAPKMVEIGSKTARKVVDYHLSRFAWLLATEENTWPIESFLGLVDLPIFG